MKLEKCLAPEIAAEASEFYRRAARALIALDVPFLVGGAYALALHTGIVRHTKDFDVFVRGEDCEPALRALAGAGYRTELTFPHWLGKAYHEEYFVDVIFGSGNGLCPVDDAWFEHAAAGQIFGVDALLVPPEEMIWSKGFIQERERFDGADIAHLLQALGPRLDWPRLLGRFGPHWRVLLGHLVLFGFIYPAERDKVPEWVLERLWERMRQEMGSTAPAEPVCQGTLLSREQYLVDLNRWGYLDAREEPRGVLSAEAIAHWTRAIGEKVVASPLTATSVAAPVRSAG
jgi:hypothetical protein